MKRFDFTLEAMIWRPAYLTSIPTELCHGATNPTKTMSIANDVLQIMLH